jgi:Spy/CpxP family protein refolding chaperone
MKSLLLTIPLMCSLAFAQGPRFHRNAQSGAATPQQMAQNETNRLTRFFSLSSTQQSQVLGILTTADTQISTLRTQIQPLRANLVAAVKANNPDQITAALNALAPLQQQVASLEANAAGQIYATVLNPTQQGQIPNGLGPLMGMGFGGRF